MSNPVSPAEPQSAGAVLMVRPACFAFNPQTADSNAFQRLPATASDAQTHARVLDEFDGLAEVLERAGVEVIVGQDTPLPRKPDAIFPNNWVSFHRDGTVVLYPMLAPNRRPERRQALLEQVKRGGYQIRATVDLTPGERHGKFLEGTGSLVLDRPNRIAYAGISSRTDLGVLGDFAQRLDYDLVTFEAFDAMGQPVYHTNVLMAVGSGFAVVCEAVISNLEQRGAVRQSLRVSGHEILDISTTQMHQFAGNLLELRAATGNLIVVSQGAWNGLGPRQRRFLERHGSVLTADIPVIERLGGGGVRCMLAEIHLPGRDPRG